MGVEKRGGYVRFEPIAAAVVEHLDPEEASSEIESVSVFWLNAGVATKRIAMTANPPLTWRSPKLKPCISPPIKNYWLPLTAPKAEFIPCSPL